MHDVSIDVPGGKINVWHRPAASPDAATAVLVHGLSGNSRWWTTVIANLPEALGLIVLDVRGRGASHDSPAPYDLATVAGDITRSLDHFEIDRAVVAGYSMGAWIVAIFATANPERVSRALLIDGGLALPARSGAAAGEIIEGIAGPSLARLDLEFKSRRAFIDHWKAHPALQHHWDEAMERALAYELHPSRDGYIVRINPEAVREGARQITVDPETNKAGEAVEVPAHIIVVERGTADQLGGMIPLETAEIAATRMRNLTMEYLPSVNHYTLLLGAGAPAVASAIAMS